MLSCSCFYNENASCSLGQKAILESLMSHNPSFLNTWKCCLPSSCQHSHAHTYCTCMHTHMCLITALISQADSPDYLSPWSRRGKPPNGMLFSAKAAKTVSKRPLLLLTHTNIILHNSADPDPTVHISLLAKGSVHVITRTWEILSFNVVFHNTCTIPRCYSQNAWEIYSMLLGLYFTFIQ